MFFKSFIGVSWYDRGDVAAYDYTAGTLTADGAWHDLDISGIVGIGRRKVLFQGFLEDNAGGKKMLMRTKGNTNEINVASAITQVAAKQCDRNVFVYTDVNGIIQYKIEVATWASIDVVIRGWFN